MLHADSSAYSLRMTSLLALAIILGVGLWLRLRFIHTIHLYPDEFATLFAIQMIGEKGVPLMPSGLFYEHGLLFSYLGSVALLFPGWLTGVRYVSLVFGMFTLLLTFWLGRRWFSPMVGLIATAGLALAPTTIHWSGRARMYALLQLLVLLTIWLAYEGIVQRKAHLRWLAILTYLAALLTHFVAITLAPPLVVGAALLWWVSPPGLPEGGMSSASPPSGGPGGLTLNLQSLTSNLPTLLPEALAFTLAGLIGFLVKRAGQPKGIDPLAAQESVSGIAQVFAIYSDFSFDVVKGWTAVNPFFLDMPAMIYGPFALLIVGISVAGLFRWRAGGLEGWRASQSPNLQSPISNLPISLFLSTLLLLTTLEMVLFVSPDRRDDKYLFMLLPVLFLLGAQGMVWLGNRLLVISNQWSVIRSQKTKNPPPATNYQPLTTIYYTLLIATVILLTKPHIEALLANTGDDYATAFKYVQEHWQEGDAIMSGTPTAAALYLGHNDFYSVQRQGGYDYRLLNSSAQAVDRWLGSPAIRTEPELHQTLAQQNVWLVLERWGLQREYYDLPFQQQLLAQTEVVVEAEAQGIFVLRSKINPQPLSLDPAHTVDTTFGEQVQLLGYTVEPEQPQPGQPLRLTLYWQALATMPHDYTVFVHLRDAGGGNVAQADHRPLGALYPTTLWPIGETIREASDLYLPPDLSPDDYTLWTGLYLLETGGRLPVQNDTSGENAVRLGVLTLGE